MAVRTRQTGVVNGKSTSVLLYRRTWQEELERVHSLSDREIDVFRLLGDGESNRSIASRLSVTERTVKAHVAGILTKLRVESRLQAGLVSYAWIESLKTSM
ncbi:LuxR C-terminal-related transcriptional regulator [Streptomyces sp. ET3-23]|uniref:response regulator transcription factor n=1 Tax=Streptomyces sp. ET3-23 TaxID=2885643 RepID=UPI001D0F805A|nr:LuxR C-terminal-related transcriptional regulator [Streptomyces sp. ET3-23]MCC2277969.1 LuxR C-terminal-related transcriptional regulator [Streptomyces sp. ET3-23]